MNQREPNAFSRVKLIPNPSSGRFHLELGKIWPIGMVRIRNLTGHTLYTQSIRRQKRLTPNIQLNPGLYFIHLSSENEEVVLKLLIQ